FFFQAEDGIRDRNVTGVQTCALPIYTLPSDEREYAQSDPWQLQQIMLNSGEDRSDIRNTFQYLARPETFEPIPSAGKKKQIRDEIGRASCREREEVSGGDGEVKRERV